MDEGSQIGLPFCVPSGSKEPGHEKSPSKETVFPLDGK